ncbi:pre-mRNA cleavage complex 2 protein Pcf11-like [Megalops cyprinoides]|uniref:pre-mRNA cleavage complex 2 protein Pcf11-like n=1 Tax=Megalops cyprinoides TaxID=118141 RepID=UPI0018651E64|nr:pre-mRNA cleavage complex 2 protein Pcf11-like [Megalops cyprinoides]
MSARAEVCKDYQSSLADLTFNSKPHINMLTILAQENLRFAKDIVAIIEAQIYKVNILPARAQPAVAYCQRPPFIPPSQNVQRFNQPGLQFASSGSNGGQVNVNNLITRLISAGLIKTETVPASAPTGLSKTQSVAEKQEKEVFKSVPDLTEFVKEDMKQRYDGVVTKLYAGKQCSSCGLRFTATQTEEYRDHLDWHYRQNRTKKDISKGAACRGWYFGVKEWTEHHDLADLEDRAKKSQFFERARQHSQEGLRKTELQSVKAALDVVDESCEVCQEKFDMEWEDEKEEWRLKNAIRVEGKPYHPSCYEDYRNVGITCIY